MRGEYTCNAITAWAMLGSSPHAWGIRFDALHADVGFRFIPTCVGNTQAATRLPYQHAVHPHVRGEYKGAIHAHGFDDGSSPRAWGILRCPQKTAVRLRFIPTCVGNTGQGGRNCAAVSVHPHVRGEYRIKCPKKRISVHPHVRGEYKIKNDAMSDQDGSSPRAWGILAGEVVAKDIARFIPTCVGNTP